MVRMHQPGNPDQPTAGGEVVLGVDTHKDVHVAAVLTPVGALLGSATFPTTADGYAQLLAWAREYGTVRRAGVEGTGSYGAALTRHLRAAGVTVAEVNRPDRAARRRRGKTDAWDGRGGRPCRPGRPGHRGHEDRRRTRGDGPDVPAGQGLRGQGTHQAINQLKAVLVRTDPGLSESLAGLGRTTLVRRCAALDEVEPTDTATATATATRYTLRQLATRIVALTAEIDDLNRRLAAVLNRHAPALLARVGIGPDTAAALLIVAGDNPRRLTSDRSFAALCGVSPIEASSGKTRRHRLNRGSDRQANAALHRIVITRLRRDPRTRAYQQRRLAEGKTPHDIVRCLKRYIAREIYNAIPRTSPPVTAAT